MIKKYNEFITNEGIIGDAFKSLFKALISNINDKMKAGIQNLSKNLEANKTDKKKIKELYKNYLTTLKTDFDTNLKAAKLEEVKTVVTDVSKALYTSINDVIKYYDNSNLTLKTIFAGMPPQTSKTFSMDNKGFEKNINAYTTALVKSFNPKLTDEQLGLTQKKQEPVKQPEKPVEQTKEQPNNNQTKEAAPEKSADQTKAVDNASGNQKQNASKSYNKYNKVFEAGEQTKPTTEQQPSGGTAATSVDPKVVEDVKKKASTWFTNTYNKILENVVNSKNDETKPENNKVNLTDDDLKFTNNKDNAKKLINKIIAPEADDATTKNKYIKVRDALVAAKLLSQDDANNMKF